MIDAVLVCIIVGFSVIYTWAGWRIHEPAMAVWSAWHLPSLRRRSLIRLWSFAWPNLALWGAVCWLLVRPA